MTAEHSPEWHIVHNERERCAQVAERYGYKHAAEVIRAGTEPLPALPLQADSGSLL